MLRHSTRRQESQAGPPSFCGVCLVPVTCSHALCSSELVASSPGSPPYPLLLSLGVFGVFLCSAVMGWVTPVEAVCQSHSVSIL